MDYTQLYNDLNQLSIRVESMEFSETMVVHRMLVRLDELDASSATSSTGLLSGAERVKNLYIFADVVELPSASKRLRLPGSDKIIIVCRKFVADAQSSSIDLPLTSGTIRFNMETASKSTSVGGVYCTLTKSSNSITRGLQLKIQNGSYTSTMREDILSASQASTLEFDITTTNGIINVVIFGTSPSGNICFVRMAANVIPPSTAVNVIIDDNILLGMEVSLLIAEFVKTHHNSEDLLLQELTAHVQWMNNLLLQAVNALGATNAREPARLLCRTQGFLKTKRPNLTVPRLQYNMYKNLIDRMVQAAQDYNQSFLQFKLYVQQQQALGSFLLEQNKAFAEKEKDMETFYTQVILLRTTELKSAIRRMEDLSDQMDVESAAMDNAREDMEAGLIEYRNRELARAFFAVIGAIASIALAFATGGATAPGAVSSAQNAVSVAGQAAQGLQKVVDILEGLEEVMELVAAIKQIVESINNIGELVNAPEMPDMPTDADWDIFVNEVELVAEQMPTEVSEVPAWKAKSKNVAALGREMSTTAAYISQLQFEITVDQMRLELAQQQYDRLSSITIADVTSYMEMVSEMDMRTTRILVQLINILHIQNAALYYEYLLVPEQVSAWPITMSTIWNLLIQQELKAITGLTALGSSSDFTRSYLIQDIPVSLLESGNDWEFVFPVSEGDVFPINWSRVRIDYIEVKFPSTASHVPSTSTGEVYILLQSSRFVDDRAKRDNEYISYEATIGVPFQYAYRLSTGETTVSNVPSQEYRNTFMRMTPFTSWRLRLSSSAPENQGLNFPTSTSISDTTQVEITFYVTAIRRISHRDDPSI